MTLLQTTRLQLALASLLFALFSFTAAPVMAGEPTVNTDAEAPAEEDRTNAEEANASDDKEEEDAKKKAEPKVEIVARAAKEEQLNGVIGRTLLFNGDLSTVPKDTTLQYHWNFGDGNEQFGLDATHQYLRSGVYTVTLSIIDGSGEYETSQDTVTVSVQDRVAVLLADQTITPEQIEDLRSLGLTQGVLLVVLRSEGIDQEYQEIQNLVQQISDHEEDIASADILLSWTSGNTGLNTFIELARLSEVNNTSLERFGFENKAIVAVNNNQTISAGAKLAQTVYTAINPNYIVVADENILDDVMIADDAQQLQQDLAESDAQYQLITQYTERGLEELSPFNFMSYMLNFMINQGVPVNSVFLILMLPVMATIIATARQFVGIKAFGIFAPTVIALSFLVTGIEYGIAIFGIIIVLGTLARLFARRIRLLYLPRMAIVLSLVALAIFILYFVGSYFNNTLIAVSIFPILIMTVLAEHFISVQIDQGYKSAIKLTLETLMLSVAGYYIGDWTLFKTTVLAYPELVLLTFVVNIIVGKFAGLRLTEYLRFRNVFKQLRNADKSS